MAVALLGAVRRKLYTEEQMDASDLSLRQSHRLIQIGMLLFLLSLLLGLVLPLFAVPRLGLSAHLIGITQGIFLAVLGLLWPKLSLGLTVYRVVFWLAVYGCVSPWIGNILAGLWGAGNTLLPIAAGQAHGTDLEELIIVLALRTGGVSLIATVVLILWGLRTIEQGGGDK
jgi:hydroxylaminobenzene mutase